MLFSLAVLRREKRTFEAKFKVSASEQMMMHHVLVSCCQCDFKLQVKLSKYGCRSGLHLKFIVFLFWVLTPPPLL